MMEDILKLAEEDIVNLCILVKVTTDLYKDVLLVEIIKMEDKQMIETLEELRKFIIQTFNYNVHFDATHHNEYRRITMKLGAKRVFTTKEQIEELIRLRELKMPTEEIAKVFAN
jgi:hypothetical protein